MPRNLKKGLTGLMAILIWSTFQMIAQDAPQPLWQLSLNVTPENTNPILYGEKVFYRFEDNLLYAVDIQTGKELWQIDYPVNQDDTTPVLPIFGKGLVFIPNDQMLLAFYEKTGEVAWNFELPEGWKDVPLGTREKNIYYDMGYLFLQTQNRLIALEAMGGKELWQIERGDILYFSGFQVLNEDLVLAEFAARAGRTYKIVNGIFSLKTGKRFWTYNGGLVSQITKPIHVSGETIDQLTINGGSYPNTLSQSVLKTGKTISNCVVSTRVVAPGLEGIEDSARGYSIANQSVEDYRVAEDWLYTGSGPFEQITNLYRFPFCTGDTLFLPQTPEKVNDILERYTHPGIMYYDIAPFAWVAGPSNDSFLFQKEGQLYKVPVPEKSFTYLYHNKTDDSVYIEPKFADIDPPPYELIPGIESKVMRVELIDGLVYTLQEDGTFQIIDFESLETVLKVQTNLNIEALGEVTFHTFVNVVILSNLTQNKQDLMAFSLE